LQNQLGKTANRGALETGTGSFQKERVTIQKVSHVDLRVLSAEWHISHRAGRLHGRKVLCCAVTVVRGCMKRGDDQDEVDLANIPTKPEPVQRDLHEVGAKHHPPSIREL